MRIALAFLAAINVYVFFFNHGTAPREILKPGSASMLKAAETKGALEKSALLGKPGGQPHG